MDSRKWADPLKHVTRERLRLTAKAPKVTATEQQWKIADVAVAVLNTKLDSTILPSQKVLYQNCRVLPGFNLPGDRRTAGWVVEFGKQLKPNLDEGQVKRTRDIDNELNRQVSEIESEYQNRTGVIEEMCNKSVLDVLTMEQLGEFRRAAGNAFPFRQET